MGTGLEVALPKIALGGGVGALGALSDDPNALNSFVDATGNPGAGFNNQQRSVDPGDILARGLALNDQLISGIQDLPAPQLGPASIIQTPAFSFGGALPAPIGVNVSDPGFLQRSASSLSPRPGGGGGGVAPGEEGPRDGRNPETGLPDVPFEPGDPPPPGFDPAPNDPFGPLPPDIRFDDPRPFFDREPGNPFINFAAATGQPSSGAPPGQLQGFIDAINVMNIGRRPQRIPGGLT